LRSPELQTSGPAANENSLLSLRQILWLCVIMKKTVYFLSSRAHDYDVPNALAEVISKRDVFLSNIKNDIKEIENEKMDICSVAQGYVCLLLTFSHLSSEHI
jgi:acetaldehyde dehydrogenase (acetylating)